MCVWPRARGRGPRGPRMRRERRTRGSRDLAWDGLYSVSTAVSKNNAVKAKGIYDLEYDVQSYA